MIKLSILYNVNIIDFFKDNPLATKGRSSKGIDNIISKYQILNNEEKGHVNRFLDFYEKHHRITYKKGDIIDNSLSDKEILELISCMFNMRKI